MAFFVSRSGRSMTPTVTGQCFLGRRPDRAGDRAVRGPWSASGPPRVVKVNSLTRRSAVLWLVLGIILLVIAIAGGAIIHPILFALGLIALVLFVMHFRS